MMKICAIVEYKRKVITDNSGAYDSSILLSIQNLESYFQLQFNKIISLETLKREAVNTENYEYAKQYKEDIDGLINLLLATVRMHTQSYVNFL